LSYGLFVCIFSWTVLLEWPIALNDLLLRVEWSVELYLFIHRWCTVKHYVFGTSLISRFRSIEILRHFNLAFSPGVLCQVKFRVTLVMWIELCVTVFYNRCWYSMQINFLVKSKLKFCIYWVLRFHCVTKFAKKKFVREKYVLYSIMFGCHSCLECSSIELCSTVNAVFVLRLAGSFS